MSSSGSDSWARARRRRSCSPPEHLPTRRSAMALIPARSKTSATGRVRAQAGREESGFTDGEVLEQLTRLHDRRHASKADGWAGIHPEDGDVASCCWRNPKMMSTVVVWPAPLGPRNATISPGLMVRSIP
jgi:hypothetical protein